MQEACGALGPKHLLHPLLTTFGANVPFRPPPFPEPWGRKTKDGTTPSSLFFFVSAENVGRPPRMDPARHRRRCPPTRSNKLVASRQIYQHTSAPHPLPNLWWSWWCSSKWRFFPENLQGRAAIWHRRVQIANSAAGFAKKSVRIVQKMAVFFVLGGGPILKSPASPCFFK